MKNKELTLKEKKFCRLYLLHGGNGAEAAKLAGYSEKTAREIAHQNLTKLHIKNEISRLQGNIEETLQISREKVFAEQAKIAFANISKLHNTWIERKEFNQLTEDEKACIAEISTQIRKENDGDDIIDVEFIKIKLFDKQRALEALSKSLGYNETEPMQIIQNQQINIFLDGNKIDLSK